MPTDFNGEIFYNTQEACEYLGISRQTLTSYRKHYGLKPRKKGLSTINYFPLKELQKIKEDRETLK